MITFQYSKIYSQDQHLSIRNEDLFPDVQLKIIPNCISDLHQFKSFWFYLQNNEDLLLFSQFCLTANSSIPGSEQFFLFNFKQVFIVFSKTGGSVSNLLV